LPQDLEATPDESLRSDSGARGFCSRGLWAKLLGEVNHTFGSAAVGFSSPRAIDMVRAILSTVDAHFESFHSDTPLSFVQKSASKLAASL
jgi:hypothetical protein